MFVAIMYCEMGSMNCGDEILRIKKKLTPIANVFRPDGVHVVDDNAAKYLSALNAKIATFVSCDDQISNTSPFRRTIKELVHLTVKAKGFFSDRSFQTQILVPGLISWEEHQFRIASNIRHQTPPHHPHPLLDTCPWLSWLYPEVPQDDPRL